MQKLAKKMSSQDAVGLAETLPGQNGTCHMLKEQALFKQKLSKELMPLDEYNQQVKGWVLGV